MGPTHVCSNNPVRFRSLPQLPKADLLTFWFCDFDPFLVAPKGDHLVFLGPNWATESSYL